MTQLTKGILQLSFNGTLMYLVVMVLTRCLKRHLSEKMKYILMGVVVLAFVIPIHILMPPIHVNTEVVRSTFEPIMTLRATVVNHGDKVASVNTLAFIYSVATLLFIVIYILRYWMFNKRMDQFLVATGESNVYNSTYVRGPLTYGIRNQKIIIPNDIGDADKRLVLRHEFIHVQRHDALIKQIVLILHIIHWFNPVFFLIKSTLFYYMETSCDELVTKDMDQTERKNYGLLIIAMLERRSHQNSRHGIAFSSAQKKIMHRIEAFMERKHYKRKHGIFVTISVIAALGTIGFTSQNLIYANGQSLTSKPIKSTRNENESLNIKGEGAFLSPLIDGEMLCGIGCFEGHDGMDFGYTDGRLSADVYPITPGKVIEVAADAHFGNYVVLEHENGNQSLYGQLESQIVQVGDFLSVHDPLGVMGQSGDASFPHVHIEYYGNDGGVENIETTTVKR
ncbi:peptidoglycan DD-metalloendopeptidase family protein [Erysipelothrix sp. HDW6C]|uniref:M56 family metallopeptidase n=1 Tax=Erysipelothrix sp. HDW6C TaxID=2714930 RepID=UPI0014075D4A|nr:M56 family metallopeptidase [Erysipelothrix sp. HDW6C]QIK68937.1 peptidoglycan DD-metalloendopeptidase family protein [Erysipelothrix sp. HDW6C]